jgi:hypothetical protein
LFAGKTRGEVRALVAIFGPLDDSLTTVRLNSGGATEIGIEPTVRHGADLGYLPVVIADACGAGNEEEAARSLDLLRFAGDAILTDTETISRLLRRASSGSVSR